MEQVKRNVALLAMCQALFMTSNALLVSTSALVGLSLAPTPAMATLPLGAQFFATMATAMPASLLMRRIGRREGLLLGGLIGIAGSALAAAAILVGNFFLFIAASAILGSHNGFCHYYRFAAAEVADAGYRSRAISLVMAGGVVAAFAGPGLAFATHGLAAQAFAASYASLSLLQMTSMGLLWTARIPRSPAEKDCPRGRSLGRIAAQPAFFTAVLCAVIGYGCMNLLMTATPLAMHDAGLAFGQTAWVIQWHIVGMFAPSFFTGHLIARFGSGRVMAAGALLVGGCVLVNFTGTGMPQFWTALALLGVGWNFLFIGATTALTWTYSSSEKARAQGLNDLLVFGSVAVTATTSGALYHWLGWQSLNLAILPAAAVALWVSVRRAEPADGAGPAAARTVNEAAARPR